MVGWSRACAINGPKMMSKLPYVPSAVEHHGALPGCGVVVRQRVNDAVPDKPVPVPPTPYVVREALEQLPERGEVRVAVLRDAPEMHRLDLERLLLERAVNVPPGPEAPSWTHRHQNPRGTKKRNAVQRTQHRGSWDRRSTIGGSSVYRFIGVWQQESSQRPQRENGATVRASGVIPHTPSLWGIAGTARPVGLLLDAVLDAASAAAAGATDAASATAAAATASGDAVRCAASRML